MVYRATDIAPNGKEGLRCLNFLIELQNFLVLGKCQSVYESTNNIKSGK